MDPCRLHKAEAGPRPPTIWQDDLENKAGIYYMLTKQLTSVKKMVSYPRGRRSGMRQIWESIEHLEAHHPRYLVGRDAAYTWFINGVGQTHRQAVTDTHSSGTFARVHIGKAPVTAPDLLTIV